jgi:hypothetical protein
VFEAKHRNARFQKVLDALAEKGVEITEDGSVRPIAKPRVSCWVRFEALTAHR